MGEPQEGQEETIPLYCIEVPRITEATAQFLYRHRCFLTGNGIITVHCPSGTKKEPIKGTFDQRYHLVFPDGAAILVHDSPIHTLKIIEGSEEYHVKLQADTSPRQEHQKRL